jgi:hypothetical protein
MAYPFEIVPKVAMTAAFLIVPTFLVAQPSGQQPQRSESAQEILAKLELDAVRNGQSSVSWLVRHPEKYARQKLDSVLDGLEKLALTAESEFVRGSAAASLASAGTADNPLPNVLERIIAVYRRADDPLVRRMILGRMNIQKDRSRAIAFLRTVATESSANEDYEDASWEAVSMLNLMGSEGRAVLIDLRDKGALRTPKARGAVDYYLGR